MHSFEFLMPSKTFLNCHKLDYDNSDIENIMQVTVWKAMMSNVVQNEDELNLPVVLFYDGLEIGNRSGSHASIHKLVGV